MSSRRTNPHENMSLTPTPTRSTKIEIKPQFSFMSFYQNPQRREPHPVAYSSHDPTINHIDLSNDDAPGKVVKPVVPKSSNISTGVVAGFRNTLSNHCHGRGGTIAPNLYETSVSDPPPRYPLPVPIYPAGMMVNPSMTQGGGAYGSYSSHSMSMAAVENRGGSQFWQAGGSMPNSSPVDIFLPAAAKKAKHGHVMGSRDGPLPIVSSSNPNLLIIPAPAPATPMANIADAKDLLCNESSDEPKGEHDGQKGEHDGQQDKNEQQGVPNRVGGSPMPPRKAIEEEEILTKYAFKRDPPEVVEKFAKDAVKKAAQARAERMARPKPRSRLPSGPRKVGDYAKQIETERAFQRELQNRVVPQPSWHSKTERPWIEYFEDLVEWHAKFGKYSIPRVDGGRFSLGRWADKQRFYYNLYMQGNRKDGKITAARIEKLNSIGFPWSLSTKAPARTWDQRFDELLGFKKLHGHCLVKLNWKPNTALSHWVVNMRRYHGLMLSGKKGKGVSTMNEEQVRRLNSIGFLWRPKPTGYSWKDRVQHLKTFKDRYGHCDVTPDYFLDENLCFWVRSQRWLKAEGKLSKQKQDDLNNIPGFKWEENPEDYRAVVEKVVAEKGPGDKQVDDEEEEPKPTL